MGDRPKAKVQIVVVTKEPALQVLLLQRGPDRGRLWQPVTGKVDPSDTSLRDAALRELAEETGIDSPVRLLELNRYFDFHRGLSSIREWLFAAETSIAESIVLSDEHVAYAWLTPADALGRLQWDIHKDGLRHVIDVVSDAHSTP